MYISPMLPEIELSSISGNIVMPVDPSNYEVTEICLFGF